MVPGQVSRYASIEINFVLGPNASPRFSQVLSYSLTVRIQQCSASQRSRISLITSLIVVEKSVVPLSFIHVSITAEDTSEEITDMLEVSGLKSISIRYIQ